MEVDFAAIRWWIDFGILGVVLLHSGFVFWDRRNKVSQEAVEKLRADLHSEITGLKADVERRRRRIDDEMGGIKTRLSDTPTLRDLSQLYEVVRDVAQVANELRGTVQSLQNTLQLINQHLLETRNHA